MKTIKLLFVLCAIFSGQALFAQTQNGIEGKWLTANKKSVIQIETDNSGKKYSGKIIWVDENLDSEKAGDALGKTMVKNLTPTGKENKYKGDILILRMDRFEKADFELKGDKLLVTVKIGFSSRTVEWSRKTE